MKVIIDYYKITGFAISHIEFYEKYFLEYLGEIRERVQGSRGYASSAEIGVNGIIGYDPKTTSKEGQKYWTLELKGQDCACVPVDVFRLIEKDRAAGLVKIKYKRVDIAWDGMAFTPEDFYKECLDNNIISVASRDSITSKASPNKAREDGEIGTFTAELGSRSSDRMVRVYNLHGPTRLEFEVKGEWVQMISEYIFDDITPLEFVDRCMSVLLQYVRVKTDWWQHFTENVLPHNQTLDRVLDKRIEKIDIWIKSQVAPSLVVLQAYYGNEFWSEIYNVVDLKRLKPFQSMLRELDQMAENM